MKELTSLKNIGPEVAKQLIAVEIHNLEELKAEGAKGAWLKIKAIDDSACIHRLYSFQGAIYGIPKKELSIEEKEELKQFYNMNK
ncbi:MAG: TfoX/Sxy family protein [Coprobacillaceae bacterium]